MSSRLGFGLLLVIVVSSLIMFFNLGSIPLLDPDEPVYAETAKEMLQFNDWLSPRIYGQFWYDKPPMYYWLVAMSFKVFGINEFAARFPSALLAIVCAVYIYFAVARLFNKRAGVLSALVLTTSLEFFYLGKAAVTDITLTLCFTVCLLSYLEKRYYLFYIFAGLATVTKGPIGFLFPAGIIFFYMVATRSFSEMLRMKLPFGILIYLLVAAPWYWFMYQLHGSAFIDTFIGFHNITRFTSPEHPEGVLWYYFIPVLIIGFMPWTAVMVQAVWASMTQSRNHFKPLLFLLIWTLFIFIFFSISRTKLVSYILPMYPPLAIIVGWYLDRIWNWRRNFRPLGWPIVLTVLVALLCTALFFGAKTMPELQSGASLAAGVFLIMVLGVWCFVWRREIDRAFWLSVIGMTVFSTILMVMLFPQAAPAFHSRDIAHEFTTHYDGTSPVYIAKFLHPGFTFYSSVYGSELKQDELSKAVATGGRAYFVVRQADYKALKETDQQKLTKLATIQDKLLLLKP
jgi:4-amino-4-deoxy-L-arabinose transferase-like glycosyltransferase